MAINKTIRPLRLGTTTKLRHLYLWPPLHRLQVLLGLLRVSSLPFGPTTEQQELIAFLSDGNNQNSNIRPSRRIVEEVEVELVPRQRNGGGNSHENQQMSHLPTPAPVLAPTPAPQVPQPA